MFPRDGMSYEEVMKHADIAMYRAKAEDSGYQFYRPELSVYTRDRLVLEEELRQAVAAGSLTPAFQPVLELDGQAVVGLETLARWPHPRRGEVSASEFIPIAEETGLIGTIDRWSISAAAQLAADAHRAGWTGWVAANLSSRTLGDRELVGYVARQIEALALDPARLVLEITESAAMKNPDVTAELLIELKKVGVLIALDDFGMGYSSLAYLKRFPVDIIKLDRNFIAGIGKDSKDERLIEAVIALAQSLGVVVLAEGVEHQHQVNFLLTEKCTLVQGYLFGRPVPSSELVWRPDASGATVLDLAGIPVMEARPFPEF
jgi:EAL domain-containing protein (putative c-di-GMP-specific phosphodiesterase class I)